jgi:hypothetical protein
MGDGFKESHLHRGRSAAEGRKGLGIQTFVEFSNVYWNMELRCSAVLGRTSWRLPRHLVHSFLTP